MTSLRHRLVAAVETSKAVGVIRKASERSEMVNTTVDAVTSAGSRILTTVQQIHQLDKTELRRQTQEVQISELRERVHHLQMDTISHNKTIIAACESSRTVAAGNTIIHWRRTSRLYRWLTKEPEPDIVTIDISRAATVRRCMDVLYYIIDIIDKTDDE